MTAIESSEANGGKREWRGLEREEPHFRALSRVARNAHGSAALPVERMMRALGARSATADRPTGLVVGDDQRAPLPPPPLLEEHTKHTGRVGWEASAGILAPFGGLLDCQ